MEYIGIDTLQIIPAHIVITITGGGGKAGGGDPVLLHGPENLGLVVLRDFVDGFKTVLQLLQSLFPIGIDRRRNPQGLILLQ